MTKRRKDIENVVDALDDVPIDEAHAKETVADLGIDVKAMAAKLRAKVADADTADRQKRFEQAKVAYHDEADRLKRRAAEPKRSRADQEAIFQALIAKAPPEAVAMHFHKYETATEEELAELIRTLRHLLGEDDSE